MEKERKKQRERERERERGPDRGWAFCLREAGSRQTTAVEETVILFPLSFSFALPPSLPLPLLLPEFAYLNPVFDSICENTYCDLIHTVA